MTTQTVIPDEMRQTPQWLCYKFVDKGNGKLGKPPVNPKTGYPCAKNDPSKFVTFDEAVIAADNLNLDGIGFVLADGWVAIDLDGCVDEYGEMSAVAQEIVGMFAGAYMEKSPSRTGIHIFIRGTKNTTRSRDTKLGIECYEGYNFMTVTGDTIRQSNPPFTVDMQDALDEFCATYLADPDEPTAPLDLMPQPDDVRSSAEWLIHGLRSDSTLAALYNGERPNGDESSDDFALLGKLAYWLNGDREAMTAAFLDSPHFKTKDTKHQEKVRRKDYLPRSIDKIMGSLRTTAALEDSKYVAQMARRIEIHFENNDHTLDDLTDIGNAALMAEVFGDRLRHTPEFGWCFWNGVVWELGKPWRALEAAKEIADTLLGRATEEINRVRSELDEAGLSGKEITEDIRFKAADRLLKHANQSRNVNRVKAMVELCTALLHSDASEFDTDPWLLNTPGGIVNLRTCEVGDHDPKYRMTSCTTVSPDFDAPTPKFDAFLHLISNGRKEWCEYLRVLVGSALIGKVYAENLVIATGRGANGKSTIFNIVRYLSGDYGTSVDPNLLMSRQATEQQVGISMVHRKRLAIAQETEEGQRLSASMLKKLCSTDPKVGKRLYKDPVEFIPTHTLILSTNHLPKVISNDEGTWRRIAVLPFDAMIPEGNRITDYHTILMEEEGAAILAWMIRGASQFSLLGCSLEAPECVKAASVDYRHKEDWLANFLNECCVIHPEEGRLGAKHSDLYAAYVSWAMDNGEYKRSSREFAKLLEGQGYEAIDNKRVGAWVGKMWFALDLNDDHRGESRRLVG